MVEVVRELLARLSAAVAARDLERVVALYEEDAVLAGTVGQAVGREAIRDYVKAVVEAEAGLSWEWDDVVADGDEVVWFYAPGRIVWTTGPVLDKQPFRLTGVLRPSPGGWRFAQFHGSVIP